MYFLKYTNLLRDLAQFASLAQISTRSRPGRQPHANIDEISPRALASRRYRRDLAQGAGLPQITTGSSPLPMGILISAQSA